MASFRPPLLSAFLLLLAVVPAARAETFLRTHVTDGVRRLQTQAIHYTHPSGVRLTLLATVHVAEDTYFDELAARLRRGDCVIYEGIVRRQRQPLARFDFAETLGLQTQSARLACQGERFIRGDLAESQFDALRNCSIPIASPPATRPELAEGLLRLETDPATRALTNDAFAILARNTAALTVLRQRLARGDQQINLLYGAAHAADLHARVQSKFGFKVESSEWLDAFQY